MLRSTRTSIARFRTGWRELFGQAAAEDPIYLSISEGRRHPGMEHWVPLFHERMETLLDYLPGASVSLDHQADEVLAARLEMIADHYAGPAHRSPRDGEVPYRPLPPDRLYLDRAGWDAMLAGGPLFALHPVRQARTAPRGSMAAAGRGRCSPQAARPPGINVFDQLAEQAERWAGEGRRLVVAAWTRGSRERLANLLREHGFADAAQDDDWAAIAAQAARAVVAWRCSGVERGFVAAHRRVRAVSASRTCWASASPARRAGASGPTSSSPRPPRSPRATWWCTRNTASAATTGWRRCRSPARRMTACG